MRRLGQWTAGFAAGRYGMAVQPRYFLPAPTAVMVASVVVSRAPSRRSHRDGSSGPRATRPVDLRSPGGEAVDGFRVDLSVAVGCTW